jgi:hypothetical protein|tara:strand:+ start:146 stop:343 length:198 start_codon:yes stop_codon:yes gene_type:complete
MYASSFPLSLALSSLAKVEKCGTGVRTSQTRKKKTTLYVRFFPTRGKVDKMEIHPSPKTTNKRRG